MTFLQNFKKRPFFWSLVALVVTGAILALYFSDIIHVKAIYEHIASYNIFAVFLIAALTPIFGFSVALIYVVVGAKFGIGWGSVVITLATVIHLLGSHWIAKSFLRKPIERFIARKKYHLPHVPEGENGSVTVMTAIIPGLPYFVRNYLLALSGIPLKTYFWICLPIYVVRSLVVILAADLGESLTVKKLIFLGSVEGLKIIICLFIIGRLRAKRKKVQPENLPETHDAK
ncbi:MAG: VTT domain-containing protein [Verrucomicrobiota bacterium]